MLRVVAGLALTLAVLTVPVRFPAAVAFNAAAHQSDFGVFLDTAQSLYGRTNEPPYWWSSTHAPNLNAPHTHVLVRPFIDQPRERAYGLWLLVGFACVLIAIWRVWSSLHARPPVRVLLLGIGALGVSGLTTVAVATGQIYPLLSWPLTEAWLAVRRQQCRLAAILLGVLVTIKPPLGLLLLWLWWIDRSTILPSLASAGAVYALGLWGFGMDAYAGWLDSLAQSASSGHWQDGSIYQALVRLFAPTRHFQEIALLPWVTRPLAVVLSGALLWDLTRWIRRAGTTEAWLALLVASWLVSPKGWLVMAWLGVPVAFAVVADGKASQAMWLAAILLLLPDTIGIVGQPNPLLTVVLGCLYLWAWLLIYVGLREATTTRRSSRPLPAPSATHAAMIAASDFTS